MHETAATAGSASIILIGIVPASLNNQRSVDRTEKNLNDRVDCRRGTLRHVSTGLKLIDRRFDKIQDDLSTFHRSLASTTKPSKFSKNAQANSIPHRSTH